ncbi:MAG: hypothetical protein U9Q81_24155 [Pseudomonadota bacterium]|nr:hypothetical protein [Pseudomonadota bacterium]
MHERWRPKTLHLAGLLIPLLVAGTAWSATDPGHGADYRTFHADGTIDYGKVANSVADCAGNRAYATDQLIEGVEYVTAGVTAIADFQDQGYKYVQP